MAQKAQHAILRFAKHKAGPAGALKSIQKQMEVLTLKKENERLRRFVDSIPPEVRRILREQQRQQRPKDHDL